MIRLSDVSKRLSDDLTLLFDIEIGAGERVGIIGPSGSGKSSLLNLLAGFLVPDAGTITLDGADHTSTPAADRPLSLLFQDHAIFEHLDVATNVALGLAPHAPKDRASREKVAEALAQVGLEGFQGRKVNSLSGGERQRVALARTLLRDRPIMLLDEPFAALGPAMRRSFSELLVNLVEARGTTLLIVSHTPNELKTVAERLLFVDGGAIAAEGPTATVLDGDRPPALRDYLGR